MRYKTVTELNDEQLCRLMREGRKVAEMDMGEYVDWVKSGEGWTIIKLTFEDDNIHVYCWPDAQYDLGDFYERQEKKYGKLISYVMMNEHGTITETWTKKRGARIPDMIY